MGGLIVIAGILMPTLLWADLSNPFVWILVICADFPLVQSDLWMISQK